MKRQNRPKKGRRVRIADVLLNILAALVIVSFLANMLFLIHMVYNDSQHGAFSYDKERGCNSEISVNLVYNDEDILYAVDRSSDEYSLSNLQSSDDLALTSGQINKAADPLCSDAEVNVLFAHDIDSEHKADFLYGINEVEINDKSNSPVEKDPSKKTQCSYIDDDGNNHASTCYEKEISKDNKLYKSVEAKMKEKDILSQLNWESNPDSYNAELSPFTSIVIPDLDNNVSVK